MKRTRVCCGERVASCAHALLIVPLRGICNVMRPPISADGGNIMIISTRFVKVDHKLPFCCDDMNVFGSRPQRNVMLHIAPDHVCRARLTSTNAQVTTSRCDDRVILHFTVQARATRHHTARQHFFLKTWAVCNTTPLQFISDLFQQSAASLACLLHVIVFLHVPISCFCQLRSPLTRSCDCG